MPIAPSPESTNVETTRWSITYRLFAFTLALGFWSYHVGQHPFDATGGWRYLTNWGHSFNLLALTWALASHWMPRLRIQNPILPVALTLGTIVVILYWSLYLIDPAMVNDKGSPMPWYSEWYMHLGSTVSVYIEAFILNKKPRNQLMPVGTLAVVAGLYITWVDRVVPLYNTQPCGIKTSVCGYPYPFLNDLTVQSRFALYLGAFAFIIALCHLILTIWSRVSDARHPGSPAQ
ncbi:MAG: hypothetical protein HOI23_00140 [Deltaproteobacteria bacterium]|jgi:hypothetical protein|nr:hypothetical protein [Deltaproteobacteria bacterium]MBT6434338.1 hypothetical protein [Deltaproteobacteria bacterium]